MRLIILFLLLLFFVGAAHSTTPHLTTDQNYANVAVLAFCTGSPERSEHSNTFVNGNDNDCNVERNPVPYGEKGVLVEWHRLADCSAYTYEYSTGQCSNVPEPIVCPVDDTLYFHEDSGSLPGSICSGGCTYNISGAAVIFASGGFAGDYTSDGNQCSGDTGSPSTPTSDGCVINGDTELCAASPPPDDPTQDCLLINNVEVCTTTDDSCGMVNGIELCYNQEQNCGNFNGDIVCVDPAPDIAPDYNYDPQKDCLYVPTKNKVVCVSDLVNTTTATNTTSNPDGSTTTTSTTTDNVTGSGSTSSTSTTTADGNSTTTTTSTTGDSNGEGDDNGSVYHGSACDQTPRCEGDPVQCAIALTSFKAACLAEATSDFFDIGSQSDEQELIDAVANGEDLSGISNPSTFDLNNLDQTRFSFASTCPADISLTIIGLVIPISMQPLCDIALLLGYFLVLGSLFISARIIL